jgi:hypothetical protein
MFEVVCGCGARIRVTAGQAGSEVSCRCGQSVPVPALSGLRQAAAAAGRPTRPPPLRESWTLWWWGVGLLAAGELIQVFAVALAGATGRQAAPVAVYAIGAVLSGFGVFAIGLGKGVALWLCLLLFFCIPFGRFVIIFAPGKGADQAA